MLMVFNKQERPIIPNPPKGLKKIPWRIPIWIYRMHIDWLFGHRMLLLIHQGRISKKPRYAVLEVIKYDNEKNIHFVASGFGEKSEWYKNIHKNPEVKIKCGGKTYNVLARILSIDEAQIIFQEYIKKHPLAIKNLAKLIGYQIGDSQNEILEFLRFLPVIAFHPT